jgi:heme-degrading monooxygenase HmoA
MIVRTWVAFAKPGNARAYREHLRGSVLPQLRKLDGFLGLSVCEAERGDRVEILVLSRWQSLDAIKAFAGPKPERAVVDPGARAVLSEFDDFATHYSVTLEAADRV